jgi:hypothetical protein
MTQTTEQPPSPQALEQGYEEPGINNRGLMIFFVIFIVTAVVLNFGLWALVKFYLHQPRSADVVVSTAPAQERFPPPNLQPIQRHNELPREDLADLRREKNEIFKQLGWSINADTDRPMIPDQIVSQLSGQRNSSPTTAKGGQP